MFKRITRSELVYRRLKADDRRKVYAGLLWLVRLKGYKKGWAAYKFKELFNEWPRFGEIVEPEQPPSDLLTWIDRQRRNYGARKGREEKRNAAGAGQAKPQSVSGAESAADPIDSPVLGAVGLDV